MTSTATTTGRAGGLGTLLGGANVPPAGSLADGGTVSLGYDDKAELDDAATGYSLGDVVEVMGRVRSAIEEVIEGKRNTIDLALVVLLAEGHLLVEDVPGVGKTMLAKALGRSIACSVRRVQFTPDLLPSDITGVSIFNQETREFEFKRGGIFANILVGDEINRASPKTQSALLESMEEGQVSVDGTTYRLESPFMVVATQNPVEMEGTYPLPEAQRDRFMARIQMGYPTPSAELDMLDSHGTHEPLAVLSPVTDAATVRALIETVKTVYVGPAVKQYLVEIVNATRNSRDLRLGASPRATLQLLRASRAYAALDGRDYVTPDDIAALGVAVLAHRVLPSTDAQLSRRTVTDIIAQAIASVHLPDGR
jgi:MoxR-like ATPase